MRRSHTGILAALTLTLAALSAPAHGAGEESIALRPRYQVGDRYALALSTKTKTRVQARGGARNTFREDVALKYQAQVEVLATDAAGWPERERHEKVDLRYERPEGSKALFAPDATFELARKPDGRVEITVNGERVAEKIEQIVGGLLAHQTEYAVAALLDPGHAVAPGDRWELEPERVTAFLRERGVRDVELAGPATAHLEADGDDLTLQYRIPIRAFALRELPKGATRTDSEGSLRGEIALDPSGFHRARSHTSALALEIEGALSASADAPATRWSLTRSESVDQRTETLVDQLASSR